MVDSLTTSSLTTVSSQLKLIFLILYFIYIVIAVECQYLNKMNTEQFKLLNFAV